MGVHPIAALQSEWSLWTRDLEADVLPAARRLGVGIVPFSPLGRGFLTGQIRSMDDIEDGDFRKTNPRFEEGNFEHNLQVAGEVRQIAAEAGATPAQVALAWLLAKGDDIVPIPGTKRVSRLEENVAADDVRLTDEQLAMLTRVSPPGRRAPQRSPDAHARPLSTPSRLAEVDALAARTGFAGVVRVDFGGETVFAKAYGLACRAHGIPNTVDTQFATVSGAKGLTALTVMSLVEQGQLGLDTTARSVLGEDLPLIDDRVTVEQLLAHRSGIGDYLDEYETDDNNDYVLTVPVHELATTEQFLAVLDGYPMKHEPGDRFVYCNGGYMVLALLAERASGCAIP